MKCAKCKREFHKPPYEKDFNRIAYTNKFCRELLEDGLTYKESKLKYKYAYRDYCAYCGKMVKGVQCGNQYTSLRNRYVLIPDRLQGLFERVNYGEMNMELKLSEKQKRILEFWRVRGWDEAEHMFGINIKLNKTKTKHYPSLNGIDLIYLEQFLDEFSSKKKKT